LRGRGRGLGSGNVGDEKIDMENCGRDHMEPALARKKGKRVQKEAVWDILVKPSAKRRRDDKQETR